jgi:hypothetical protein
MAAREFGDAANAAPSEFAGADKDGVCAVQGCMSQTEDTSG